MFEYTNLVPSIPITGGKKIPYHSMIGDIAFENVTFSYPTRPEQTILKEFSLDIKAGKMIALVNKNDYFYD